MFKDLMLSGDAQYYVVAEDKSICFKHCGGGDSLEGAQSKMIELVLFSLSFPS